MRERGVRDGDGGRARRSSRQRCEESLARASRRKFTRSPWSEKTCVSGGGVEVPIAALEERFLVASLLGMTTEEDGAVRCTRATNPRVARPEVDGTSSV